MVSSDQKWLEDENRKIRFFRLLLDIHLALIWSGEISINESLRVVNRLREVSESLFPGKGHVFDLVCLPRLKRAIKEVFSLS